MRGGLKLVGRQAASTPAQRGRAEASFGEAIVEAQVGRIDRHVTVELFVPPVRCPAGRDQLQPAGEGPVLEEVGQTPLDVLGTSVDIRFAVVVAAGLDVKQDADVHVRSVFDFEDDRKELDTARRERSLRAVQGGGNDFFAQAAQVP